MFRHRTFLSSLILASASASFAVATDWPQWRGPNRDGISTEQGLLKEWPKGGPPLAWRINGLGSGMSSVAIAGGRLFTQGARNKDGQRGVYVTALDLGAAKELWATAITTGSSPEPNGTPTVDGALVYAVGKNGDLACLEAASGKLVWKKNFGADFGGKMMSGWGYSESPLVDGDRLIIRHPLNWHRLVTSRVAVSVRSLGSFEQPCTALARADMAGSFNSSNRAHFGG